MPRSFLISKLQKWKESGIAEGRMESDDDMCVTNNYVERTDDNDQMVQVRSPSTDEFTAKIGAVTDKSDDVDYLTDFIGTSPTPTQCRLCYEITDR